MCHIMVSIAFFVGAERLGVAGVLRLSFLRQSRISAMGKCSWGTWSSRWGSLPSVPSHGWGCAFTSHFFLPVKQDRHFPL